MLWSFVSRFWVWSLVICNVKGFERANDKVG